ncbi:MAG: phage holin [Firmicutes bacterium]|nr:phage holin [Bacillota bacterium]
MKADTIIRTAVLALALFNQCLAAAGRPVLPIEEESVNQLVSAAFTVCAAVAAWWKNNSFSQAAIEADRYLDELRRGE